MMMAPETGSRTRRACAAVVLYRPDIPVLAKQAQGLAGVRLFAFANGSLDPGALAAVREFLAFQRSDHRAPGTDSGQAGLNLSGYCSG